MSGGLGEDLAVDLLFVVDDFHLGMFVDGAEQGGVGLGVMERLSFGRDDADGFQRVKNGGGGRVGVGLFCENFS